MAYNNYFPTGYQPYYQTYQPSINQQVQPVQQPTQTNNGLIWVQGETGNILAYATKLDGKVYAVIYTVKLDSDTTSEAMSMIPKTLYMKRIYQK